MPPRRLQVCGLKARGPCALPRGAVARATTATRGVRHCSKFRAQDDAFDASGSLAHPSGLRSQTRAFPITRVPSFIPTSSNTPKTCPRSVVSPYTATSEHAACCLRLATAVAPRTPRRGTSHTSPRRRHSDARVCAPRGGAEPSRAPQAAGAPRRKSQTQTRRRAMGHGALRDALRGRLLARRWVGGAHRRDAVHGLARAAHPRGGACCRPEERKLWCQRLFSRCAGAYFRACVWGSRHRLPVTLSNVSHQAEPQL